VAGRLKSRISICYIFWRKRRLRVFRKVFQHQKPFVTFSEASANPGSTLSNRPEDAASLKNSTTNGGPFYLIVTTFFRAYGYGKLADPKWNILRPGIVLKLRKVNLYTRFKILLISKFTSILLEFPDSATRVPPREGGVLSVALLPQED
jgi:hypothetical protein